MDLCVGNIRTGLVSVSFRKHTPEEILKECRSAGLKLIEWGSDVHAPCNDIENLQRLAKLQESYGIACCSYGTYFRIGVNAPEEIFPYISAAKLLGTSVLRVWCGDKAYLDYSETEKEKIFNDSVKLAGIAKRENVVLCTEFHPYTYTDSAVSTLDLLKRVNSPALKTYWQPNQFKTYEKNVEEACLVAPFTENIHIFNWSGDEKYPLVGAADKWIEYLKKFDKTKTLLLEFMPDDRIETLKREADSLRKICGGIV